ncbi:MAG: thymidylate kinase [Bacilli bacterium]|nr:thymidylate kinase [Bacilli bacterium]
MNKIIVIEGTDCSGKETQSKMLLERLNEKGFNSLYMTFPAYESPTGKIVGGSYLGKESIGKCVFPEGAVNVDAKVASLYYAADRLYNKPLIEENLKNNNLIIDRYVESNMAHQGSKILDKEKRLEMYNFLSSLEYDLLKLPRPDITIFLYMPYEQACILKKNRTELDQHELNPEHLKHAEKCYLELSKLHNYIKIDCVKDGKIRTKEDINNEIYEKVMEKIMG